MHNSVTNLFDRRSGGEKGSQQPWDVDSHPGRRLVCLYVLVMLPLVAVAARLVHLQIFLPDEFTSEWEWTTETLEPIPSHDGRILSADGTVLAQDTVHCGISMHYRWLEEPADPRWLGRKALSLLDRSDRRNKQKVEAAQQQILAEREAMWRRLSELTSVSPSELTERRQKIQQRVERIVESVERRQKERLAAAAKPSSDSNSAANTPWWERAWNSVKAAVTTTPTRTTDDPVVLPEEQEYYLVIDDVPLSKAAQIETSPRQYPGLLVRTQTDRIYPEKSLAAHIVGARTPLDDDEWKKRREQIPEGDPQDYQPGDRIGNSGIERSYDRRLHGLRGQRRIIKDRHGQIVRTEIVRSPRAGDDIELTVHVTLQRKLEELLDRALAPRPPKEPTEEGEETASAENSEQTVEKPKSAGGSLVVLDVRTGDVLAAVSAPRYDLNLLIHPDAEQWRQVNEDPRRPFFPRVTRMTLPPGSVFKPLSAVALIESGINPDRAVECHGYHGDNPNQFRCYHSLVHGPMTLADALCRSCNVYFFAGADTMGPLQLVGWARRFGFGQPTGIDLPGESGGNLPSLPATESPGARKRSAWHISETRGLAIGQGRLTVTPLQIVRLMATIANDGNLVTPRLVNDDGFADDDLQSADRFPSLKPRRVAALGDGTLQHVREGLERVVSDPHGTGYKTVRMQEIAIAGKTGTAETGGGRPDHAWFAGYVPADRPRYAFVVVLEFAGSGGKTAGPVAHDLVQTLIEEGLLQTTRLTRRD